MRKKVIFTVGVVVILLMVCLGQSFANGAAGGMFILYPTTEEPALQAGAETLELLLVPEEEADETGQEAQEATADGNISDFLIPETDHGEDNLAEQDGEIEPTRTEFSVSGKPNVLIYHTHTTEAYRQEGDYTYEETGESRTEETDKNIVQVGEDLKAELEALGFNVIHDTTDHEPPKLATAYSRSEETMQAYREKYPDMDLYIDVHRDAANVEENQDDVVVIDGKRCARLMFVVGKGEKYDEKPDFESNYALASAISEQLEAIQSGFTRDIRVKTGRYNQHISDMCLLVEVGHNANTLEEAENSMPYLAQAIGNTVKIKES